MKSCNWFILLCFAMFAACTKSGGKANPILTIDSSSTLVSMKESDYRPAYHFTPPLHWMNDPNGLVYNNGTFHLFYQYNPDASVWGNINWGHATSTDLFNWKDQPVAIAPDAQGLIFSGSAVVDANNTSGLKSGSENPMVAVYTIAGTQQAQGMAYSNDGGTSWTKYVSNPVLPNPGTTDFRDPKVSWNAAVQKWIMALATGNKISFYSSADLKSWTYESAFGENTGAHGGVWECPDLFQLPVEGSSATKWVLLVSVNPGGPNGGSSTQYFVGDFDGHTFTTKAQNTLWVDYGTDNYAGVTYNNIPAADGRRVLIGWMSNWNYAQQVTTTSWRSTMTVPRTLSLAGKDGSYLLKSYPVDELKNYEAGTADTAITAPATVIQLQGNRIIKSGSYEMNFTADLNATNTFQVQIGNSREKFSISLDKVNGNLVMDRGTSGNVDFNGVFKQQILCPFVPETGKTTDFRILVDKTSVELFINGGEKVMTAIYFPVYQYNYLKISGNGTSDIVSNFTLNGISKSLLR